MCQAKYEQQTEKHAAVHNYVTGEHIEYTDVVTFDRYQQDIGDCDIGAVMGVDYGYEGIIYMVEI